MSPERARGEPSTLASDLWSLGATLYAALDGRSPFERSGSLPTLNAVLHDPAPRLVPGTELGDLISALLAKEPARRPSPLDVHAALLGILARPNEVPSTSGSVESAAGRDGTGQGAIESWLKAPDDRLSTTGRSQDRHVLFGLLTVAILFAVALVGLGVYLDGWRAPESTSLQAESGRGGSEAPAAVESPQPTADAAVNQPPAGGPLIGDRPSPTNQPSEPAGTSGDNATSGRPATRWLSVAYRSDRLHGCGADRLDEIRGGVAYVLQGTGRRTFPPRRPDDRAEGRPADRLAGERTVGGRSAERLRANLAGSGRVPRLEHRRLGVHVGRPQRADPCAQPERSGRRRVCVCLVLVDTRVAMGRQPRNVRRHCAKLPTGARLTRTPTRPCGRSPYAHRQTSRGWPVAVLVVLARGVTGCRKADEEPGASTAGASTASQSPTDLDGCITEVNDQFRGHPTLCFACSVTRADLWPGSASD